MDRRDVRALSLAITLGGVTAGVTLGACSRDPEIQERTIVVYAPRSCPISQSEAFSVIYGHGDFDLPATRAAIASLWLRDVGTELTALPAGTRSVVVDVSLPRVLQAVDWQGTAEIPPSGPINVLVWPGGETCRLTRDVQRRTDVTLGIFGRHLMVAGGRLLGSPQVPNTFVGDLSTGKLENLPLGLGTRRSRPSVTAFATTPGEDPASALVAGGEDPDRETPIGNAEVYLPKPGAPGDLGDFDRARVELSEPRARHGAVVLSTGETLLVGGIGSDRAPLRSMEIIDPRTRAYRTNGVALLQVPRAQPIVLRLASGEIFVAGGTDNRQDVPTLEWFTPDASRPSRRPVDLVAGAERAFVALPAGGVLAVIKPKTPAASFPTVWVISADGTPEPGNPIDSATLDTVRLFPGTDGAPVLWTGRRWMRWDPWFSVFLPIADAPQTGPVGPSIASGDDGLALWLDDRGDAGMNVTGYRFATKSRFGTVPSPLLVDGLNGLAPDRVTGFLSSSLQFVAGQGLQLGPGASAFVTDFTFANVSVEVEVAGSATSVVLREDGGHELEVGGAACPLTRDGERALYVERVGKHVRVRLGDGELRECPTELSPTTRVAVGLRGAAGGGTSLARNLRITRR